MRVFTPNCLVTALACLLAVAVPPLRADQLQMQNGDRYAGKVVSMSSNSIVIQSDLLGTVTVPRDKVASLTFGANTSSNAVPTIHVPGQPADPSPRISPTNGDLAAALRNLGSDSNMIQQVRQQMLPGGNAEVNQKYDEMLNNLMTGKMSMEDLRNQAKTSIDQINQLKRELGPQADESLDAYLAILQNFVNETTPATSGPPAAPARPLARQPAVTFRTNSAAATPR